MKRNLFLLFLVLLTVSSLSATSRLTSYNVSEVRLLSSDGNFAKWSQNEQLDSAWIMSFPATRLLHSFRTTAGAFSAYEGGYSGKEKINKLGGWESLDCDLRGHAVGHLLSAYALLASSHPACNASILAKADSLVQGIRECQQLMGTGYIGAFPPGLLVRNLQGKSVWAPWYTLHKLVNGLIMQYQLCGNTTALDILTDFTTWADNFLSYNNLQRYVDAKAPTVEAVRQRALRNEFGGIGESFYDIYLITGNKNALRCSDFFYQSEKMDPLYAGNFDMGTMHCNTFLPKVMCEAKKSSHGQLMADAFWHEMINHHTLAPGCLSDKEHFFNPAETSKHLTGNTGETCCTYNMLKLTRSLYAYNPNDPTYFDYFERALYNHILGQQDPESGMVHYFLPTLTGAYKLYSTYDRSFWCCVGSSFESHAKYAESIYWHNEKEDTVYVNLFIPSVLEHNGLKITLQTEFPLSEDICLSVTTQKPVVLMVRQPSWTGKSGYRSYKIKKGSRNIVFKLPMQLYEETTPDNDSRTALFFGPVLLAGQLGTVEKPFSNPDVHNDYYGFDYQVPDNIKEVRLNLKSLKRTGALQWQTAEGITIKPLFDTHRQRYVTYWNK